jgi:hypothetical protein
MEAVITGHTRVRMHQRGIRADALKALLDHGRAQYLHKRGREIVYFDKAAKGWVDKRVARTYAILAKDG